ncbi:cell division protein FtsL [Kaistia geumhonensis]|uniref:Cell division protein FtsL n=1 Tax=Kaistia geumhonensis TaxID=410839 RepID=A0ABU0MAU2_9HYPH|nr:cell division protein FtsL [Kaistia geumhonensis]
MLISAIVATCVGFFYRARKARRLVREQSDRARPRDDLGM